MSPRLQKPPSDRELNADIVRLVMAEQFPSFDLSDVRPLGSGWEYDVYVVDHHQVVRFPRYADVATGFEWEHAALQFVGTELGDEVAVPRINLNGVPGPHFPHHFDGYELIPGIVASDVPELPFGQLAEELGRALTHVHGISLDRATHKIGGQKFTCASAFQGLLDVFDEVPALGRVTPEGEAWARAQPGPHAEYGGPPRFIHDDLHPEHLIVDRESGRLNGIIDWGGVRGDPAQDYSFIAGWAGWDFTTAVIDAYDAPVDDDFVSRVLFLGRVRAMGWLWWEVQEGLDTSRTLDVVNDLLEARLS